MKKFSWKKIATLSGIVLGGGLLSFVLSGFLPVAVMPLKLFLFFASLSSLAFVGATIAAGGVMQYQQDRANRLESERKEIERINEALDCLFFQDLSREEVRERNVENSQVEVDKVQALKEETSLDKVFHELANDTIKMIGSSKQTINSEEENLDKNNEEGIEI